MGRLCVLGQNLGGGDQVLYVGEAAPRAQAGAHLPRAGGTWRRHGLCFRPYLSLKTFRGAGSPGGPWRKVLRTCGPLGLCGAWRAGPSVLSPPRSLSAPAVGGGCGWLLWPWALEELSVCLSLPSPALGCPLSPARRRLPHPHLLRRPPQAASVCASPGPGRLDTLCPLWPDPGDCGSPPRPPTFQ